MSATAPIPDLHCVLLTGQCFRLCCQSRIDLQSALLCISNANCLCGMVQLPRLYNVYKEQGIIENFEQLLDNIFHPLFEVTKDPNTHPQLHLFLQNVSSS